MSDILIPMAHDPRGHDMHDDTAAWAQENVRPFRHEVCRNTCGGGQSCNCIMPAEACTELGADDYSAADKEQSQFITVVLVIAVWVLALPAAWFGVAHLFKTLVESAP